MNAVEIEEAISELVQRYADEGFDADNFPFDFLAAFGNPEATLKRLRSPGKSSTNQSDTGGVLQSRNIHLKVAPPGKVGQTLRELVNSPETAKRKCKFALATDGVTLEAENLTPAGNGETLARDFADLPDRFTFFLELAGIRTVKAIRENAFDVKATGRLNKLYVELLRHNPDWGTADRREAMNHFMARLIFCFFAEDTGIFHGESLFPNTVQQMSESDASNTHEVIAECFRAMDTSAKEADREAANIRPYANTFPYVNGGLFGSGSPEVPRFTKTARAFLLHIGSLDWTKINPDIFGSMIQAVADDEERGALGMHYTSVPNILKVLNPLFLDELRKKLDTAGVRPQRDRDYFVTPEESRAVLDACPDVQWRVMFALARYAGLRTPSETLQLRWEDIDWHHHRLNVRSPKTEHHDGHDARLVPLFPELLPHLQDAFDQADDGDTHVITRYTPGCNLGPQLKRIATRAGLKPWPKLWQNLRATRVTELAQRFPQHVATAWLGHSAKIAEAHYLQVTAGHFAAATQDVEEVAQNPTQNCAAYPRTGAPRPKKNRVETQGNASQRGTVARPGLEPDCDFPSKLKESAQHGKQGGAKSDACAAQARGRDGIAERLAEHFRRWPDDLQGVVVRFLDRYAELGSCDR